MPVILFMLGMILGMLLVIPVRILLLLGLGNQNYAGNLLELMLEMPLFNCPFILMLILITLVIIMILIRLDWCLCGCWGYCLGWKYL